MQGASSVQTCCRGNSRRFFFKKYIFGITHPHLKGDGVQKQVLPSKFLTIYTQRDEVSISTTPNLAHFYKQHEIRGVRPRGQSTTIQSQTREKEQQRLKAIIGLVRNSCREL
jgi:hypothetical protein